MKMGRDVSRREVIQQGAAAAAAATVLLAGGNARATVADDLPAVAGGKPIKTTPFSHTPRYGEPELRQLREAIEQQTLFYAQGKKVKALEAAFAKRHGVKHAVACSSGTAAIHSAMIALGISPGDEVI